MDGDDGETPERLTAPAVAVILGMHRASVLDIPADELPYEPTPGGREREGRRYYDRADVEAYRLRRLRGQRGMDERLKDLERRMDDVERRLDG